MALRFVHQHDGGSAQGTTSNPIYTYQIPASGGYDAVGNIKTHIDSVTGTWTFNYDTLSRLTAAQNTAVTAVSQQQGWAVGLAGSWQYDGFGNRKQEAYSVNGTNVQLTVTTPSTSNNNQVAGLQYDGAGDVTYDNRNQYLYDGEGRLCAVNAGTGSYTEYVYDALGARVAKGTLSVWPASCVAPTSANGFTVTAQYLLGLGGEQVTELNGSATWVHTNVWAGARLTATYDTAGLHFNLADPLGTRRVQASAITGMAELDCLGLAWGNNIGNTLTTQCVAMQPGATDDTEHHFTGKERDTESGNDYFGARYYSSMQGRFMSPDSLGYQVADDPQSLNLYTYVMNNPLTGIDTDGHAPELVDNTQNCWSAEACFENQGGNEARYGADQKGSDPKPDLTIYGWAPYPGWWRSGNYCTGAQCAMSSMALWSLLQNLSKAKDWYDRGMAVRALFGLQKEIDYWTNLHKGHLAMWGRDRGDSKNADPMHIPVDLAQLKLDENELAFYDAQRSLTWGTLAGYMLFPKLGELTLQELKDHIDYAEKDLDWQTSAYNRAMGARSVGLQ